MYKTIIYTKVEPKIVKQHRKQFHKKAFIKFCAYSHKLDFLSKDELKKAKKGILPPDLDIHHIIPLSGTYSPSVNDFNNLVILHKSTHKYINRKCFQPQLKQLLDKPYGTQIEIKIPVFNFVDTQNIILARKQSLLSQKINTI